MRSHRLAVLGIVSLVAIGIAATSNQPNLQAFRNSGGIARTFSTSGSINMSSAFFKPIGTNGRSCVTCHQASDGWSVTAEHLQQRFEADGGLDPVFRPVDGANCPSADVSTVDARRNAYSLLLKRGLIRVQLPVPTAGEFTVESIDDPYSCAETNGSQLALYRRPLPAANLPFLTTVMWDGRESTAGFTLSQNLGHQAVDATIGHAEGLVPSAADVNDIVKFETELFTAQTDSSGAGELNAQNGAGGPVALSKQPFFVGINDPLGPDPTKFNPSAMTLFSKWENLTSSSNAKFADERLAIARGEVIFNTFPINISGVKGLNDALHQDNIPGTCTTCHNTPNVGNHSVALAIDIGLSDASRRTADMPLYTLRNKITGQTIETMDPGRAMVTGKWADIGKTKGPVLRGLSSRAPYFHNGSAATIGEVLDFYETKFHLGLTTQQRADLEAFLAAL
jgi:cytochrome c peroxidase